MPVTSDRLALTALPVCSTLGPRTATISCAVILADHMNYYSKTPDH